MIFICLLKLDALQSSTCSLSKTDPKCKKNVEKLAYFKICWSVYSRSQSTASIDLKSFIQQLQFVINKPTLPTYTSTSFFPRFSNTHRHIKYFNFMLLYYATLWSYSKIQLNDAAKLYYGCDFCALAHEHIFVMIQTCRLK